MKSPDDDALLIANMDEFAVDNYTVEPFATMRDSLIPYLDMVPELGRFFADTMRERVVKQVELLERSQPEWYITYADNTLAGEVYNHYPRDAYQYFLARAWVKGDSPELLWKYADLPYVLTGDWHYIHKLAETIKAYRGVTFRAAAPVAARFCGVGGARRRDCDCN